MIPNYQVRFKDISGQLTHVMAGTGSERGGLAGISCELVLNGTGSHAIALKGDTDLALEIGLDYQVEVWRRPAGSQKWVLAYEGLHRTWVWQADASGEEQFISYGASYNSLLARRIVAAYAGSAGSDKAGKAESVIKAYVNENAGPGAADRLLPGFAVQTSGSGGNDWTGSRSWRNLLEVCQDIAYAGGGDFQVVGTGPATFEFRWFTGQMGTDRTIGNENPVVFSLQRNNMLQPVLSVNHGQEYNCVYVLGSGEEASRTVLIVASAGAMGVSPWNRVEVSRQATNEGTTDGLTSAGVAELRAGAAQQSMGLGVAQTPECAYGVHYFLGDIVSALYKQRVDKKIVKVSLDVTPDDETIKVELADVA